MIGRLTGKVVSDDVDGSVLLDVGGVGYALTVPLGTLARAAKTEAGGIVLSVHTHVREGAIELFGFCSETERQVFRLIIGVPNVGPKIALGVLSTLPLPELAEAVERKDIPRLNKINGVGRKTAERLVLELREKLPRLGAAPPAQRQQVRSDDDRARLVGALTNMGYKSADAERAVKQLGDRVGQESLSDLLRAALAHLAP